MSPRRRSQQTFTAPETPHHVASWFWVTWAYGVKGKGDEVNFTYILRREEAGS